MAKKKKKSWIEQRDNLIKNGQDVQSAKGDYSPSGHALQKVEEERARQINASGNKSTTRNGSAFTTSMDKQTKGIYEKDRYNSYLLNTLSKSGYKVPKSALQSYDGAVKFLSSQGIDASSLMTQKSFIKNTQSTYNQKFDLKSLVTRAEALDPVKTATNVRQSYNDIEAVKRLATNRKDAEQLKKDIEDYRKNYGDSKALNTLQSRADQVLNYINENAKGGSAVSNKVFEQAQAPFSKSPYDTKTQTKQDIEAKYAVTNEVNMREKYGDLKYDEVKQTQGKTPVEKEWLKERQWQIGTPEQLKKDYAAANEEKLKLQEERDKLSGKSDNINQDRRGENKAQKLSDKAKEKRIKQIDDRLNEISKFTQRYRQEIEIPEEMARFNSKELPGLPNKVDSKEIADIVATQSQYDDDQREYLKGMLLERDDALDTYNYIEGKLSDYKKKTYGINDDSKDTDRDSFTRYRDLQYDLAKQIAPDLIDKIANDVYENDDTDLKGKYKKELSQFGKRLGNDIYEVAKRQGEGYLAELEEAEGYERGEEAPITSIGEGAVNRNIGGLSTFFNNIGKNFEFNTDESKLDPVDYNASGFRRLKKGQAQQEGGLSTIDDENLKKVYQAVNSGADMGLATLEAAPLFAIPGVGKKLGTDAITFIMGTQAGASAMLEAHEQGMSDREALQYGLVSGLNETAGEKFSIETILNAVGGKAKTLKNVVSALGKSFLAEGSEEVVTDLLNQSYDNMVNGENSLYNRKIKEFMKEGLTKEQATKKADKDFFKQLGDEFTVGGLAGLMFGGGATVASSATGAAANALSKAKSSREVGNIINNSLESGELNNDDLTYMADVAIESSIPEIKEKGLKVKNKLENNENISKNEIGSLSRDLIVANEGIEVLDNTEKQELNRYSSELTSGLNERQSELMQLGAMSNMPETVIDSMIKSDNGNLPVQQYFDNFNAMYAVGKDTQISNIDEALQRVPQIKSAVSLISPEAATVAFEQGNSPSVETIVLPQTKPKGRFVTDFDSSLEEAKVHDVLQNYAKLSGLDIVVTNDMSKYTNQKNAQGMTFLENGKVVLDRETANILGVADHEILGHFGKALAPKAYKELANIVSSIYREDLGVRGYDNFVQQIKGEAKAQGINLDESTSQEEAIAYGLETMAMNPKLLEQGVVKIRQSTLTETEKKLILDKIREFIKRVISYIKQRIKNAPVRTGTESMLNENLDADLITEAKLKVFEEMKANLDSMLNEKAAVNENKNKTKYSLKEIETEYDKAVKDNDMDKAAELVQDYAFEKGYTDLVYHGTDQFGFTKFNEGWVFTTDDLNTAATYSDIDKPSNIKNNQSRYGNYALYANVDGLLRVEGNDAYYNEIEYNGEKMDTIDIANIARKEGYSGVMFKDIIDPSGMYDSDLLDEPSYVMVFFKPEEQLKSADPITYDDNGEVVPLNKRFNKDYNDIRYSLAPTEDSEGNKLSKEQQDYFKDSKIRDEEGNLLVMYHGTPQGNFTIFNKGMNYFTPFKEYAEEYKNPGASAVNTRKQTTAPKVYEVYLNITKPFDIRIPEVKDIFINEYVKGGYAQGINPYEEYKDTTNSGALDWVEVDNVYEWLEETGRLKEYDGIIADEGGVLSESGEVNYSGLSYITFNSNQAKNIDNKQPTKNDDIRYSLAPMEDSEGNKLSEQQSEYFANSKVRDKEGRLQVVYHGTMEDFNTFDRTKARSTMDIQGLFFSPYLIEAEGYGEKVKPYFLNIKNPADESIAFSVLNKYKGQNNAGIKAREELESKGYDGVIGYDEYIIFNSNQAKLIDNKKPTTNDDIRLSLKEELTDRDIDKFRSLRNDIGKALGLTEGSKLDTKGLRQLALQLKETMNTKTDTNVMMQDLEEIGTLIETKGINNTDTLDRVKQFVINILENEKQLDPAVENAIKDIRKQKIYLSDRDIKQIPDFKEFWRESFGVINRVRKQEGAMSVDEFFEHLKEYQPEVYNAVVEGQYPDASTLPELVGWMKTAKEDSYSLLDMYGDEAVEYYINEVLNAYSNAKIEDILNDMTRRKDFYNKFGELIDTVEGLNKTKNQANQSVLNQVRKQQAQLNLKLDEQRRNLENKYKEQIKDIESQLEKEKDNTKKQIKAIREKQRIREKKARDRRNATNQRQVIRRTRDRVKTTINNPTIKKYIPKPLQKPVQELFNSIDLGEQYSIARLNKMRENLKANYSGDELKMKLRIIDDREFAFMNALREFRDNLDMYTGGKIKGADGKPVDVAYKDNDTYFNPVIDMIDQVIDLVGDKSLMNMDYTELKEVSKVLRAIEKATIERSRPQTFEFTDENGKKLDTFEQVARLGLKQTKKISKGLNVLNSHLSGRNTLLAMDGFNPNGITTQIANKIDEAYIIESKIKQDLHAILDPVISEKKGKTNLAFKSEEIRKYGKDDLVDVGFKDRNGNPILLNHDSLIFEYLNLASEDNLNHIARGGELFPNYKDLYARKSKKQIYSGIRTNNIDEELTQIEQQMNEAFENEDYDLYRMLASNKANLIEGKKNELKQIRRNIEKHLTAYDKKLINAWKKMLKLSTDMLNDYWLKTFGYENFNEENYWHISVDPNFIKSGDGGNVQQVVTNLSESGSTIARVKGAGNPIMSGSAIFAFDEYIDDVAKRIAYAGLQRDMNAVMRYKVPGYKNMLSEIQDTMPKIAENFETFQLALFGGLQSGDGSRILAATRGLAARATLSPNLRVALAQVPSFLGTYRYTDGKAIKNAWLPKNRVKQSVIDKYTPLMWARGATGFSLETADLKQDTNKLLRGLNKADRLAGGWIFGIPNKMDAWTVRHTFGAYLDYARRKFPNLEEGTKEQIENGESPLYKKAAELFNEGTMRTQPMFNAFNKNVLQLSNSELKKSLTIFHTQPFQYLNLGIQDIMEYKYEVENSGKNSAKAKKARTKALKSLATILGGTTLFTLIKIGVDKTIRHKKDEVEPEEVAEQLISSMANMFVLGSTLVDGLYALITKDYRIYDFEIYGTQIFNSLKEFAVATAKALDGEKVDYKKQIINVLSYLGIPAANVEKDLGGIIRNIEDYVDNGMRDYSNEKTDTELIADYINGDLTLDGLKELGIELNDNNKTKFGNAVKKLYTEEKLSKDDAIKKLLDSKLFESDTRKQPTGSYIQGKIEWWDIENKYKDEYISTLSDKGAETKDSRKVIAKIAKMPYENAFWENPDVKTTWKSYKSSYDKLLNKVKKWHKE